MTPLGFAGPDRFAPVTPSAPAGMTGRAHALTNAWRDWLVGACRLDDGAFQLVLGTFGADMGGTAGLARIADMRAGPVSATMFDPAGGATWSQAYLELLHALQPLSEHGLRGYLGGLYDSWIACRNAAPSGTGHTDLFGVWAANHLPPHRARRARLLFADGLTDPLCHAMTAFAAADHRLMTGPGRPALPRFTGDAAAAWLALQTAPPLVIDFDTDRHAAAIARSGGRAIRPPRLSYFQTRQQRAGADLRKLDAKALDHRITVTGHAARAASMATSPLGWLDPFELSRAWSAGDDPAVWEAAAGRDAWGRFFGPCGSLSHRVCRILLATGVAIDVTSHARWHRDEVDVIRSEATGGAWPLVPVGDRPAHVVRVRHNSDGTLTHSLVLPAERFAILGALTEPAPF